MSEWIKNKSLSSKIMSADDAAALIRTGMTIAFGGYTSCGYPKQLAGALVRRKAQEEELQINVVSGSALGPLDEILSSSGILCRRTPMIGSKAAMNASNAGRVLYVEQQMNRMPQLIRSGAFGKINVAVLEVLDITEKNGIILSSGTGMPHTLLDVAERIILEVNTAQPEALRGMHDLYRVGAPPYRDPVPLRAVSQRIGTTELEIDPGKLAAVVYSDEPDVAAAARKKDAVIDKIAENLFSFLEWEFAGNTWIPPFQTGFGNLASGIVEKFADSSFAQVDFFCGGINESCVELLLTGKVGAVSCGSVEMTPRVMELFRKEPELLRRKIILRNGEVTNNSEVISRLGLTALNTGLEIDIFGNVNSSHITGTRVVNGLGGGANFAENAGLSVVLIPAEGKNGMISNIVPMVSHQDIGHHDVDVVITENGVADLRGKTDTECAELIIEQCAGSYRDQLRDFFGRAASRGGHHPLILQEAFSWHQRYLDTGSMRM